MPWHVTRIKFNSCHSYVTGKEKEVFYSSVCLCLCACVLVYVVRVRVCTHVCVHTCVCVYGESTVVCSLCYPALFALVPGGGEDPFPEHRL